MPEVTVGNRGIGMTSQRTRGRMVQRLRDRGIRNERVLKAMETLPRHLFVDEALASRAYEDCALPIDAGQTISQPYIVARMTEFLLARPGVKRVLEVGTGSGYQCALLALLVQDVFSVERIERLHLLAKKRCRQLGLNNVRLKYADGGWGWDMFAPYDGIMLTAAPEQIPDALVQQLKPGGVMVAPVAVSPQKQELRLITRTETGCETEVTDQVSFVPMLPGQSK
ncbi:MAG: protein-L-isoaspartate(D-aspartate) O-methyltransferase [bacterium]